MKDKAIIFDLDGVLIDAAIWHYDALNSALTTMGYEPIDYQEHLKSFNGLPTRVKLETLGIAKEQWGEIIALKQHAFDSEVEWSCKPDPEKLDLIFQLSKKYVLACCSNATRRSVFKMLGNAALLPYFDFIVGNDDGFKPKPDPEMYDATIKKTYDMGAENWKTHIIEDSKVGMTAALNNHWNAQVYNLQYDEVTVKKFKDLGLL
jgi:beta-phosphoglucomutase